MLRTAVRRKSWRSRPAIPAFQQAVAQALRKSPRAWPRQRPAVCGKSQGDDLPALLRQPIHPLELSGEHGLELRRQVGRPRLIVLRRPGLEPELPGLEAETGRAQLAQSGGQRSQRELPVLLGDHPQARQHAQEPVDGRRVGACGAGHLVRALRALLERLDEPPARPRPGALDSPGSRPGAAGSAAVLCRVRRRFGTRRFQIPHGTLLSHKLLLTGQGPQRSSRCRG
jgi:hypothetical protein